MFALDLERLEQVLLRRSIKEAHLIWDMGTILLKERHLVLQRSRIKQSHLFFVGANLIGLSTNLRTPQKPGDIYTAGRRGAKPNFFWWLIKILEERLANCAEYSNFVELFLTEI